MRPRPRRLLTLAALTATLSLCVPGAMPSAVAAPLTVRETAQSTAPINDTDPLLFGQTLVGSTQSLAVALDNKGNDRVYVHLARTTGPFQAEQSCEGWLAPGQTCTVNIMFAPQNAGEALGSLRIATSESTTLFPLQGQADLRTMELSPLKLTFGAVAPGDTAEQDLTLHNTGTTPARFTGFQFSPGSGLFHVSGSCPGTLSPGDECSIPVMFTAGHADATAVLQIESDAWAQPARVSLTAHVVTPTYEFRENGAVVTRLTLPPGDARQRALQLINTSPVPITFNGEPVSASSPFEVASTTCTARLPAGASCRVVVTSETRGLAAKSGKLMVWSNAQPRVGLILELR